MINSVFDEVSHFLEEVQQTITHHECELCSGKWLVTVSNVDRYGLPIRFVMCRQCGLVTQNPRWDRHAYSRFYTDFYRRLVTEWRGYPSTATSGDSAVEWLQKMARTTGLDQVLPKKPRVMEIGGGNGAVAEFLRDEFGAEVTIIEPNAREAEEAAAKGLDIVVDVFENMRFDPETFDLIVIIRTVDHLIDASDTFTKIRTALKPSGHLLVDGADFFRRMAFLQDPVKPLKIDHCYYFSPETLPLLMRKNGLIPVITDTTVLPGEIVILAEVGMPEEISVKGVETLPAAERRYIEWEQLAQRPDYITKRGYLIRSLLSDLDWLKDRTASKLRRK